MAVDSESRVMERDAIRNEIAEITGLRIESLAEDKRLFHDLRLYGDEAVGLLTAFGDRNGVDWSKMPFLEYFPPEGPFVLLHARLSVSYRRKFREFTVRHFTECVLERKWIQNH